MPRLVRLYLISIAYGLCLGICFTALVLWADVAGLRHLLLGSPSGWIAVGMLCAFHGFLFSGVQFGIAVMRLTEKQGGGKGGSLQNLRPAFRAIPVLPDRNKPATRR